MPEAWIPWVAGFFGLALGSFLNVCTLRWPVGESVVRPRSRCPGCGSSISARDNVPVLGWILLRGRCRTCREPISVQYPLVELATALIWAGAAVAWGGGWEGLRAALFLTILLGIAVSDARFYIIPDEFTLGGAALGLALAFAPGGIDPVASTVGAAAGFVGFQVVGVVGTWVVRRTRPDRLEQAFEDHDEQRADPVVQARVARLRSPGLRALLVAACGGGAGVAWAWAGFAGPALVGSASLAAVAILLAWGEAFDEATFEPERAAARAAAEARAGAAAEARGTDAGDPSGVVGDAPTAASTPTEASGAEPADAAPMSALGGGDIRMMALVGAFLGPVGVVLTTLGGSLLALVAAVPLTLVFRQLIPLGIFLAYAAAGSWLWGDEVVRWYLDFVGLGPG